MRRRPVPVYIVPPPRDYGCGCALLTFIGVVLALTAIVNFFGVH